MIMKRYDAYAGCNTSIDQIARECGDGEWVKLEDLAQSLGLPSIKELDAAQKRIAELEAANKELLAALQKAVGHPITGDWYDDAMAAIAKANGGANT